MGPTPVSFTYTDGANINRTYPLRWPPTHTSWSSGDVWHIYINYEAWKIFTYKYNYAKFNKVYQKATQAGLPTPGYRFKFIRVDLDNGRSREGFAVVTTHMPSPFASFFSVTNSMKHFKQLVRSITNERILLRIEQGCTAARNMKLRNPHGYITLNDPSYPIMFIDPNPGTGPSHTLRQMVQIVIDHRRNLRR